MNRPVRRRALTALAALSLVGSVVLATPAAADPNNNSIRKLTKAVTLEGVLRHFEAFQAIADANGGQPRVRAARLRRQRRLRRDADAQRRLPGDRASRSTSRSSRSSARRSPRSRPPRRRTSTASDYDLMDYSGYGDATEAAVVPVDLNLTPPRASTSGCEAADFQTPSAKHRDRQDRAACSAAPARSGRRSPTPRRPAPSARSMMNQGNGDPVANADRYDLFAGTLGTPVGIPAVSVSYFLGEEFANTPGLVLRIEAETISDDPLHRRTCSRRRKQRRHRQRRDGRCPPRLRAGHRRHQRQRVRLRRRCSRSRCRWRKVKTPNAVRFAWWGAEEANLVGLDVLRQQPDRRSRSPTSRCT